MTKIVGLGGSLRAGSRSLHVLKIALEGAAKAGASTDLIEVSDLNFPFYVPGQPLEAYPNSSAITDFIARFQAADGVLLSAPTYHAAPAAAFKNALDFLEFLPRKPHSYLTGRVGGLMVVAGGTRWGAMSLNALLGSALALRLIIAPGSIPVAPARTLFDAAGNLTDEGMRAQVTELGVEVATLAATLKTKNVT
jgi:FMN reductase